MSTQTLILKEIDKLFTVDSLKEYFEIYRSIKLIVDCEMFRSANSNLSIADDYLFALFLGESIYPYCSSTSCCVSLESIDFDFHVEKTCDLVPILMMFAYQCNGENDREEERDNYYMDLKIQFQDKLFKSNKPKLFFHELADSYMGNIILGEDDLSLNETEKRNLYDLHPEEEFGYYLSFISPYVGYNLYVSSQAWIIPHGINKGDKPYNLDQLLLAYGGIGQNLPIMEEAFNFAIKNLPPVFLSNSIMVRFPVDDFNIAQECAYSISRKKAHTLLTIDSSKYTNIDINIFNNFDKVKIYQTLLSEDGKLMIIKDDLAQYIFFTGSVDISLEQNYQNDFDCIAEKLSTLTGNHVDISCPWEKIDDEIFEQLCYDLIEYSSDFDLDTRQKMGKSRSRDGGRDIEVYTRSRLNKPKAKWIIQCKLLKKATSLAGSKVQVSDVIDQYGAKGFWIMTNGVIDATLHDKLNGIARNRKIGIEKWDCLKIERILAKPKYKNIRMRYFGI